MLTGTYRDLFAAIATSAAALTGLLFVVVTVRESRTAESLPSVVQEVRAAVALLSFTNALAVSLFGLVPGTNVGYPAAVVGVIGVAFSAGGMRSVFADPSTHDRRWRDSVLIMFLVLVFTAELVAGIYLIGNPRNTGPLGLNLISYVLVGSLFVGIARAWELVGGRDTGIVASLTVLTRRHPSSQDAAGASPPKFTDTDDASKTPRLGSEAEKSE